MMSASQGSSALKAAARPIVAVVSKRVPTAFSLFSVKASLTLMPSGGVKVYFFADLWVLDFVRENSKVLLIFKRPNWS